MRTAAVVSGVALAIAVASLAADVKVKTAHDKDFNFKGVSTWAWHPEGMGDADLEEARAMLAKMLSLIWQASAALVETENDPLSGRSALEIRRQLVALRNRALLLIDNKVPGYLDELARLRRRVAELETEASRG